MQQQQQQQHQKVRIGLLAVQGAFVEHKQHLQRIAQQQQQQVSIEIVEIRRAEQLNAELDALIVPGGESTTVSKFMVQNGLLDAFNHWFYEINKKSIVWGICAGLISLSDSVVDMKNGGQNLFKGLGVTTDRNFYGRQADSFETKVQLRNKDLIGDGAVEFHGIFIRAPKIISIDNENVIELASCQNGPVAVMQNRLLGCSFHPELSDDSRFHEFFLRHILMKKYQ